MDFLALFTLFIRVASCLSSLLLALAPVPSTIQIYRSKTTGNETWAPLVTMLGAYYLWMLYGLVTNDLFPLFATYAAGFFMFGGYLMVFYRFSKDKRRILVFTCVALAVDVVMTLFVVFGSLWASHDKVQTVLGSVGIAGSILMYASPFAVLKKVIETKDSVHLPIRIVLAALVVNILWLTYGFLVADVLLIIPCACGFVFTVIQVAVFVIYRRGQPKGSPTLTEDMLDGASCTTPSSTPRHTQVPPV